MTTLRLSTDLYRALQTRQIQAKVFYQNSQDKKFYLLAYWPFDSPVSNPWGKEPKVSRFVESDTAMGAVLEAERLIFGGL